MPQTIEDLQNDEKSLKKFNDKIEKLITPDTKGRGKQAESDVFGFFEYLMSPDLSPYIQSLLPKATKKKPLSFERLNMIVMPLFKYLEQEKTKTEYQKTKDTLNQWLQVVTSHQGLNLNTQFER